MNLPTDSSAWLVLDSVDSTQDHAIRLLREGTMTSPVVLAHEQTAGKGRLGRSWDSPRGESLALSVVLAEHKDHSRPWLLGMAMACAAAAALHCRLRWPNDLYLGGKKLGGILTEVVQGIPVIGIGVNLGQKEFPSEIASKAISLVQHRDGPYDALAIGSKILAQFNRTPPLHDWADLAPVWDMFDDTLGKNYLLPSGDEAKAIGIGPHGELLCTANGEARTVLAAGAIFGA